MKADKHLRVFKNQAPKECPLEKKINCVNCELCIKLTSKYVYCGKD